MIVRNSKGQFVKGIYLGFGFKKGQIPHNKGIHKKYNNALEIYRKNLGGKLLPKTCKKMSKARKKEWDNGIRINKTLKGKDNQGWKGEKTCYAGKHAWISRYKGSPDICECCGKSGLKGHQIHWANIDHKYSRKPDDYIRLCVSCHQKYDNIFNRN